MLPARYDDDMMNRRQLGHDNWVQILHSNPRLERAPYVHTNKYNRDICFW